MNVPREMIYGLSRGKSGRSPWREEVGRREKKAVNIFDWILIAVGAFSVLRGLWRGAVSQIFGLLGFGGGFFLAYHQGEALGARLAASFPSLPQPVFLSYALLFVLTWFLIALAGAWISRTLHSGGLGGPDRILGGALGMVKGALAALLLVWGASLLLPPNHPLLERSRLVPYGQQATRFLVEATPKSFREKWEDRFKQTPLASPRKNAPPETETEKKNGAGKNQSAKRGL